MEDLFIDEYDASELKIAAEFLTNWLPFLSKGLCEKCVASMRDRIGSLGQDQSVTPPRVSDNAEVCGPSTLPPSSSPKLHKSWADMAQEDELEMEAGSEEERSQDERDRVEISEKCVVGKITSKSPRAECKETKKTLTRDQREHIRFMNVVRNTDFICLERVGEKITNILDGLELHTGVFSAAEQKRIVDFVHELQEGGRKGELGEWTYSERKEKKPATIQFGCCYSTAPDKDGNPRGILRNVASESIPSLFKVIIRRLIRWHVLPPSCIPDSCSVHIFEPGDFLPPQIVSHDFLRPLCTVSFLSECSMLFGSSNSASILLPVGSAFVMSGNGANVAKHSVAAVPSRRISIAFRRMNEGRRPLTFKPEADLQSIQPLACDDQAAKKRLTRRRKPSRVVVDARSTAESPPRVARTVVVERQRIVVRRSIGDVDSGSRSSVNRGTAGRVR
ncbi:RNA demethylase ALKBH9B-like [Wolffia australiana]